MRQAYLTGMPVSGFPSVFQAGDSRTCVKRCLTRLRHVARHQVYTSFILRCLIMLLQGNFLARFMLYITVARYLRRTPCQGGYPAGAERRKANEGWPEEKAGPGTKEP